MALIYWFCGYINDEAVTTRHRYSRVYSNPGWFKLLHCFPCDVDNTDINLTVKLTYKKQDNEDKF